MLAERSDVDREPEDEEEERREEVAEAEEPLLDLLADGGLGEDDAGHQRADRLGDAEPDAIAAMPTTSAKTARRKNSLRQPVEHADREARQEARGGERDGDEAERLRDARRGSG